MLTSLTGKKILVTAGPTWVPIDKVRVITNVFGGNLGVEIVKALIKSKAQVTFLFGPGRAILPKENPKLHIVRYKYYDELLRLVKSEIGSKKYDVIVHSSAVADYTPLKSNRGKIKSGRKDLIIRLKPTIKIVDLIKKIDPKVFLIKFKLEVGVDEKRLINIAYDSMIKSKADLIVANEFSTVSNRHKAFIIDKQKNITEVEGKSQISLQIVKNIKSYLSK